MYFSQKSDPESLSRSSPDRESRYFDGNPNSPSDSHFFRKPLSRGRILFRSGSRPCNLNRLKLNKSILKPIKRVKWKKMEVLSAIHGL
ncbi:hypothetical protein HNY73_002605 [Argiope bruennichi]|uniref:Uncharacterized protein n=1 Tax=Argiope bruennichi TaxID=94029 RepID=A0A8T0FVB6_ARGBR|nr:hypothetical protein HNY73_002605 [Argiope bruennichi]